MSDLKLPYCSIQNPACGACGSETSHDGDSFYCEPCGAGIHPEGACDR